MSTEIKNQKELLVNKIVKDLSREDLRTKIEILANVFLAVGVDYIDVDVEQLNNKTIYEQILRDIKNNGDTLGNTLVRQGLMILDWLNEGNKI